jgi:enediyne core biosynthesis thioesterase
MQMINRPTATKRVFEHRHTVGFEETNLVGNVYYANHLRWQGRCREMFLHTHAPEILEDLARDLALVTVRVSCEFFNELFAFNQVLIEMSMGDLTQNRVTMRFEYWREENAKRVLIARGEQQVAAMRRVGERMEATPFPNSMARAFRLYAAT